MSVLEIEHLAFAYRNHPVLRDISLHAERGEYLSILGCNGSGKSTLFRCILGLLSPQSGTVRLNGRDLSCLSIPERAKEIAYVPQHASTVYNFSVEDVVLMGTTSSLQTLQNPGKVQLHRAYQALERVGIEDLAKRCYHQLSGGEQQLVILARALAQDTELLVVDEPTSSLDFGNQLVVLNVMRSLSGEGYTILQTTHNPEQSFTYSDRIVAIKDGMVLKEGTPEEVITEETIGALYGVNVRISSLFNDKVRVCTDMF